MEKDKFKTRAGLLVAVFIFSLSATNCKKENEEEAWKSLSPMPTARHHLGFVEHNGLLYAIGGYNANGSNKVEVYNPVNDTWEAKANMPTGRGYLVVAAVNGKIYAIGGVTGGDLNNITYTNVTEEYDPSLNRWTVKAPFPNTTLPPNSVLGNQFITGAAINGKIYVAVGSSGRNGPTYIYDPATNTWSSSGTSIPRFNLEPYFSAGLNNEMFATDGDNFLKYSSNINDWALLQPLTGFRKGASLSAFNNVVYAAGGYNFNSNSVIMYNNVDAYNLSSGAWTKNSGLNVKRHSAASVIYNGNLYVVGGASKQSNYTDIPVASMEVRRVK